MSPGFPSWLAASGVSLLLASRADDRLLLIAGEGGGVTVGSLPCPGPQGIAAAAGELWLATGHQLWRLGEVEPRPGDPLPSRRYVPRAGFGVGAVGVRDLQVEGGRPLFVDSLYGCVGTLGGDGGLRVLWRPPWVSGALAPEDRSRLGGVATAAGEPRFVAAAARSDLSGGWRHGWLGGGVVVEVATGETVCSGLSLPRSPRLAGDGRLWLLLGAAGQLGFVEAGRFSAVADLPGFPRHMILAGEHAVVALSPPHPAAPLPLRERLPRGGGPAACGVAVIHLASGRLDGWIGLGAFATGIDAVAALPAGAGVAALGGEDARRLVTFREPGAAPAAPRTLHWLAAREPLAPGSELQAVGLPAPRRPEIGPGEMRPGEASPEVAGGASRPAAAGPPRPAPSPGATYAFHPVPDASVRRLLGDFEGLTFPDLAVRHAARPLREPLLAVAALVAGAPVGLAVAQRRDAGATASCELVSLCVHPAHRRRGVGGELLARLEAAAAGEGMRAIEGSYRSGWPSRPAIERLLAAASWGAPAVALHLVRLSRSGAAAEPLVAPPLPSGCELFAWSELGDEERRGILARQSESAWYPDVLTPFQEAPRLEPRLSVGLRCHGEVAGWLIAHRVAADTVQYSTFFVRPDLQRQGAGLALMAAARERRLASEYEHAIFAVEAGNERMLEVVQKRLRGSVDAWNELRVSGKPLC